MQHTDEMSDFEAWYAAEYYWVWHAGHPTDKSHYHAMKGCWLSATTRYQEALQEVAIGMQAVIDRWDSPNWKDLPHTANYISQLRNRTATINKLLGEK